MKEQTIDRPLRYHNQFNVSASRKSSQTECYPSSCTSVPWIHAAGPGQPKPTLCSGKWLIFCPTTEVDPTWDLIRQATEGGLLGFASKVSTAHPGTIGHTSETRIICVYTYDYEDTTDVRRIRSALRDLGITQKIPYKADEDTLQGKYSAFGHKRISQFYE